MSYFIFPQAWITPAILAAAVAFGPPLSPKADDHISVKYRNLPGQSAGFAKPPTTILIDKRPASEWPKEKAQCVLVHEYAHLAGRQHSKSKNSIMNRVLRYRPCHRWLVKHHVS